MIHVFCNLAEDEDGVLPLCDMTFEIEEKHFDHTGQVWHIDCRADAKPGDHVGFGVDIPVTGWTAQVNDVDGEEFHSFWGLVSLRSMGARSDRLICLIADYYGLPQDDPLKSSFLGKLFSGAKVARTFAQRIDCLAVGIQSDPRDIEARPINLKLFFDEGKENGHYAELFLDVDLRSGLAMLNEKDEDYRADPRAMAFQTWCRSR